MAKSIHPPEMRTYWESEYAKCSPESDIGDRRSNLFHTSIEGEQNPVIMRLSPNKVASQPSDLGENRILTLLERFHYPAPQVLYADPKGRFSAQTAVGNYTLGDRAPPYTRIRGWQLYLIGLRLSLLHTLPAVAELSSGKILDPKTRYCNRVNHIRTAYLGLYPKYQALYNRIIPEDPLEIFGSLAEQIEARDPVLCHGNLSRGNIRASDSPQSLTFVGWDRATLDDPYFDLGAHMHHMKYHPHQRKYVEAVYYRGSNLDCGEKSFLAQIKLYEDLERVGSVLLDVPRWVENFRGRISTIDKIDLATDYWTTYAQACQVWRIKSETRNIIYRFFCSL